jgi:outer membrane lipoprotein-sorting protein
VANSIGGLRVNGLKKAMLAGLAMAALGAAGPATAALSPEEKALEDKASAYLEGLTAAEGRFVQTDARGQVTQGSYYLQRPGRIRFEYDAPAGTIVVSDGHNVTVYDRRLQTFNAYPLSLTPLHVFLAKSINLDQEATVDQVRRTPEGFEVIAHDGRRAKEGSIALHFADNPVRLTEWTITDGSGRRTRVQLTSLKPASGFDSKLFVITEAPKRRR